MRLGHSQVLEISQKLSLDLSQQLKLECRQQLQTLVPTEFEDFISFESDEDIPLLQESLPFLILHETSHPLYSFGKLHVPEEIELPNYDTQTDTNALEVGIDRGSYILGTTACKLSPDEVYKSHIAIAERVIRDMLEIDKVPATLSMIARLDAEVQQHLQETKNPQLQQRMQALTERIEDYIKVESNIHIYRRVRDQYQQIYRTTRLDKGARAEIATTEGFLTLVE